MIERKSVPTPQNRLFMFARQLPLRQRRWLVLATLVGFPGLYVWSALTRGSGLPLVLGAIVAFGLLWLTLAGGTLIWLWTRNRVDLKASLDERERQVRDRVYVRSYQAIGAVTTAIVVVLGLMTAFGSPVTLDFQALTPFIIGNAIYFPALPSLVFAWTEPDPLPEDQ